MAGPLMQVRDLLGLPADGLSAQTRRALREHGELVEPTAPAASPVAPVAGPQPSADLLSRVKAQQEAAAKASLERALAARRAAAAAAAPSAIPAPMPLTTIPRRR